MALNRLGLISLVLLFLVGCSKTNIEITQQQAEENEDLSCAYFYFLWGSHAEYNEDFSAAQEAYEKALICDPKANYVREKIPILLLKMGEFDKAATWLKQSIKEHQANISYQLLLANIYIQQEKMDQAILVYKDILASTPNNEGVSVRLAILYSHLGQYNEAEVIFENLLKKEKISYFTRLSYARLLKEEKKYQEAYKQYEKALELNWSKELAFELGHFYVTQDLFEEGLRIYTTITRNDKFDERAALSRIQALLDLKRHDDALEQLQKTRKYSDNRNKIDILISKVLLQKNEVEDAKKVLYQLIDKGFRSEPYYMLALLAYQQQNYALTLEHLGQVEKESEIFEEAVYLQVNIYEEIGELDKGITLLSEYIVAEESRSPLFYALLSSLLEKKGEIGSAINTLEDATQIYDDNHQLVFELGLLLERSKKHDAALDKMLQVIQLHPDHAEALNYVGYIWADSNSNLEQALEYILRANELKPNNGFIIDSLGWVYFKLGNLNKALLYLQQSLNLEPTDPHIHEHLGDVYNAKGDTTSALSAYQKAEELFQNKDLKSQVRKKINTLKPKAQ